MQYNYRIFLFFSLVFCFFLAISESGFKGKDGVAEMVQAFLNKKIKLDEFITHNMPLDHINEAIELLKQGKRYKALQLFNYYAVIND